MRRREQSGQMLVVVGRHGLDARVHAVGKTRERAFGRLAGAEQRQRDVRIALEQRGNGLRQRVDALPVIRAADEREVQRRFRFVAGILQRGLRNRRKRLVDTVVDLHDLLFAKAQPRYREFAFGVVQQHRDVGPLERFRAFPEPQAAMIDVVLPRLLDVAGPPSFEKHFVHDGLHAVTARHGKLPAPPAERTAREVDQPSVAGRHVEHVIVRMRNHMEQHEPRKQYCACPSADALDVVVRIDDHLVAACTQRLRELERDARRSRVAAQRVMDGEQNVHRVAGSRNGVMEKLPRYRGMAAARRTFDIRTIGTSDDSARRFAR